MSNATSILLIAALVVTLPLSSTETVADTSKAKSKKKTAYGAIARHVDSGSLGYSYDLPSARAANVAALEQCAHERCEIVLSIANECGAIADGPKSHIAKKGNTRAEAETRALNACGKDCRPIAWACTR